MDLTIPPPRLPLTAFPQPPNTGRDVLDVVPMTTPSCIDKTTKNLPIAEKSPAPSPPDESSFDGLGQAQVTYDFKFPILLDRNCLFTKLLV